MRIRSRTCETTTSLSEAGVRRCNLRMHSTTRGRISLTNRTDRSSLIRWGDTTIRSVSMVQRQKQQHTRITIRRQIWVGEAQASRSWCRRYSIWGRLILCSVRIETLTSPLWRRTMALTMELRFPNSIGLNSNSLISLWVMLQLTSNQSTRAHSLPTNPSHNCSRMRSSRETLEVNLQIKSSIQS
jgi:hypothetical protein